MSDTPRTLIAAEVAAAWSGGEAECRVNWAKAAQLPPMPSELLLIAKDPLIGQALAKWAQSVCEQTVTLRNELSAAQAECETWKQRAESAEADAGRYLRRFAHIHVNNGTDDACKTCLLDLRDPIHSQAAIDARGKV